MKARTAVILRPARRGQARPPHPTPPSLLRRHASTSTASRRLDLQSLDSKWQQRWQVSHATPQAPSHPAPHGKKAYILPMFPYPSGTLHLGHLRVYTISDVLARFKRMCGYEVLHPMGWDAFGLPAENAATERGVEPGAWTVGNVERMRGQLMGMGAAFDWGREFRTCDPAFYKHTQRIFLMLYERGLAYQAEALVNYDPVDRTVLANEQVDANGFSWRSGAKVEKLRLKQWFLRISAFRESLLMDLDDLAKDNRWPARVLSMQRNWLGRSSGANVRFTITTSAGGDLVQESVRVFTTRADTLYGVQYLALSTTHPIVQSMANSLPDLQAFIDSTLSMSPDSKIGYLLPSVSGVNPLAALDNQPEYVRKPLPVYVAPYVLGDYGEGAVMGVPGHDTRDHAFWRQNRGSEPIRVVVEQSNAASPASEEAFPSRGTDVLFTSEGVLTPICGRFAGLPSSEASRLIVSELGEMGGHAEVAESWRLRDWLISRQRYWGTPIPIVHCDSCGTVPVPMDQLPVELPKFEGSWLRGKSGNPLESAESWVKTKCPSCGGAAKWDTDTMDTFVDSSWYYARFADPHNKALPFDSSAADAHLPVDVYIGGVEHAILHLLYARFISKFLATTSLWPSGGGPTNKGEPFRKVITQGMVHGKTYSNRTTGRFLKQEEVDLSDPRRPTIRHTGEPATVSWEKMSKSKHNGVDPAECIRQYGADATRAHMLFQAPVGEVLEWHEEKIVGIQRWFGRVWKVVGAITDALPLSKHETHTATIPPLPALSDFSNAEADLWAETQRTIQSVTHALENTHALNTVISDLIKLTNSLASLPPHAHVSLPVKYHVTSALLRMLAPVAPAFAEECWEALHLYSSVPSATCLHIDTVDTQSQTRVKDQRSTPTETGKEKDPDSIFHHHFPTTDPSSVSSLEARARAKQTCAVQENGKLRFAVEIGRPPDRLLGGDASGGGGRKESADRDGKSGDDRREELESWVLRELGRTEVGGRWLRGKGYGGYEDGEGEDEGGEKKGQKRWKRIVVVRGGRTVNFVG